jgi:hypothetical protein
MTSELVPVVQRKFRKTIPEKHRASLDTMIHWLWHQRFGTVQTIWQQSQVDGRVLDHTAATLILQAIMGKDLESISQIFQRIEGGSRHDKELLEQETTIRL